jgi:hypothetical protein
MVGNILQGPSTNSPKQNVCLSSTKVYIWPWTIRSCTDVTTLQVPMHNSIVYLLLERLALEKLSLVLPVGLVSFHLVVGC